MNSKPYDVIIAGYGPVGAVLANMLGRDGLSVLVVDRMGDIYDKPRAINIDHEVMRALQSVGLADAIEPRTIVHPGTDFLGINDRLIKIFEPVKQPYPLYWAPNLMFIQPEFEPVIRAGAERYASVEVRLETTLVETVQGDSEVRVLLEHKGEQRWERGKYLIASDGATSGIRKQLGIEQDSLDFDEWWTVIDAWLLRPTPLPRRTTQYCRPSGPATYVVGPKALRRWEIKLMPGETPRDFEDPSYVKRRLGAFVDPDALDLWRVATYRFHALVAHQWKVGRIFLAGDAAHQMPPFMAQGLCSGVRDAANLGWKLSGVLRGAFEQGILDTYEEERKPHIRQLVATAKHLGEIIGELDVDKALVRDETLGAELDSGKAVVVRQRLIPDLTAGIIAKRADGSPAPAAGTLFPQPLVQTSDREGVLLDDLVGERFLVLTSGENAVDPALAGLDHVHLHMVGNPAPATLQSFEFIDRTGILTAWMRGFSAWAVIVRPDKYVFGIAMSPADLASLSADLTGQIYVGPNAQSETPRKVAR